VDNEYNTEAIRKFDSEYDQFEGGFPNTPEEKLLDWREFNSDIAD
jgi:hypothetical protein